MSQIHPVAGYVLVKPQKRDKTTASGIVLPDSHEDKPQQGTVLSVGVSTFQDNHEVKAPCEKNDVVIYREWGGKEYKEGTEDLLILKFEDIMAIIK
ncbi:MAG: co-chaperone GroES [Candidatus Shapirobacteria bacterium]|jgi:chaperonin GroES